LYAFNTSTSSVSLNGLLATAVALFPVNFSYNLTATCANSFRVIFCVKSCFLNISGITSNLFALSNSSSAHSEAFVQVFSSVVVGSSVLAGSSV